MTKQAVSSRFAYGIHLIVERLSVMQLLAGQVDLLIFSYASFINTSIN